MNIGSVVDFPGRKPYCVLSIDVIYIYIYIYIYNYSDGISPTHGH